MRAIDIISEWKDMTTEEQLNYCKACVCAALKDSRGRYYLAPGYEFDDAAQSTYLRAMEAMLDPEAMDADNDRRTAEGKAENTLGSIISRVARAGLSQMDRTSRKHGKATNQTVTDSEGNEIDLLNLLPADNNTERTAINRAAIKDFFAGLDTINQTIIKGKADGLTERELAAIVGISGPAVHKRIVKMRADLIKMII